MGFFNHFPYTNFHELNESWILETIKGYEDTFKEIREEWQKIWEYLQNFPNDMYAFASQFKQEIRVINSKLYELEYLYNTLNYATPEELSEGLQRITQQLETNIITLKSDIKLLYSYIDNGWLKQKEYIDQQDGILFNLIKELDNKPVEPTGEVISPFTLKLQSVQDTFNEIYKVMKFFSLTSWEYRYLHLTADQYKKLGLTSTQYDMYGKFLLWRWRWMKESPMCITAAEYQYLNLTADGYKEFKLTAWQYAERSLWYLGNAPLGNLLKYSPNPVQY